MTKQDVLTKLALECPTWWDTMHAALELSWSVDRDAIRFSEGDWLSERERLLNLHWDGVPERYKFSAIHADGVRWFFVNRPVLWEERGSWEPAVGDGYYDYMEDENPPLAIPAGYDWRDSLEERPV